MAELQTRGHRSHGKLPGAAIRSVRLLRFSFNYSTLEFSNLPTASLQSGRQVALSDASISKLSGWIWHHFNVALSWSLYRFRGLSTCRVPCSSSPKSNIHGIRVSFIRAVCPAQRRRTSIIRASMPRVWHLSSTSVFVTRSFQLILAMRRRHLMWKLSSCLICLRYIIQVSQLYSNTGITCTATLYTASFVDRCTSLVFYSLSERRPNVAEAFAIKIPNDISYEISQIKQCTKRDETISRKVFYSHYCRECVKKLYNQYCMYFAWIFQ